MKKVFSEVFTVSGMDKTLVDGKTSNFTAIDENGGIRSFDSYNEALEFIKNLEPEEFDNSVFSINKHFGMFELEEEL